MWSCPIDRLYSLAHQKAMAREIECLADMRRLSSFEPKKQYPETMAIAVESFRLEKAPRH
jgi:hypothetical protein